MRLLQGVGVGGGCAPSHAKRGSFSIHIYFRVLKVAGIFTDYYGVE